MKCLYCGCTDNRACLGGCHWVAPQICSACAEQPQAVVPGQLWRDVDGQARVWGVVQAERTLVAVMMRTRGAGGRSRRPFLFPVESLQRGDDGWQRQREVARG